MEFDAIVWTGNHNLTPTFQRAVIWDEGQEDWWVSVCRLEPFITKVS